MSGNMYLLQKPNQRLTVLLFIACAIYMSGYLLIPHVQCNMSYYQLMVLSYICVSGGVISDIVSLSFGVTVTYVSGCVFFFARYYMEGDIFVRRFMWILLSFVISMNVLIFSGSLVGLLVGWDGLGVSSFALIMYYHSKDSLGASFMTLLINRLGDVVIMSSMLLFSLSGCTLLVSYSEMTSHSILLLFTLAALTKSAQYPFSAWLPAAMAAPTPVSALVHSSTLVTAGIYIIIRACVNNSLTGELCSLLLFFGSVTSFIGGICAVYENDLKKLIALSTLSQLGVMVFSLGLNMYNLALLHLFTHAMFKALLFLVAGSILMMSFGVQDIRLLGGVCKNSPLLLIYLNVSAFCLMGLPFLSAFYSKHAILTSMWGGNVNMFSVVLMLASTFLSSFYMVRLLKGLNWGSTNTTIVCVESMFKSVFYTPLNLLFIGSCLSGFYFMFSCVDFISYTYPVGIFESLVSGMGVMGVLGGLVLTKQGGKVSFSSMFYMTPVWQNSLYGTTYLMRSVQHLDQGWLEPYTFVELGKSLVTRILILSSWSFVSLHFVAFLFMWLGLVCWVFWF